MRGRGRRQKLTADERDDADRKLKFRAFGSVAAKDELASGPQKTAEDDNGFWVYCASPSAARKPSAEWKEPFLALYGTTEVVP
jgi:hypothetical protein